LPQEVCDSLSKSSARCNLGLTWDQTNFFASKSLASVALCIWTSRKSCQGLCKICQPFFDTDRNWRTFVLCRAARQERPSWRTSPFVPHTKKMHSHEPKTLDEKSEGSSRDEMDKVFVRVTINRVILAEHFNGHSGPRATLTFALKKKYCPNQLSLFLLPSCAALAERAQQESRQPGYS
jgi:hypothetical protein